MASQYGMEWKDFKSAVGLNKNTIKKQAQDNVKDKLCAYSIAKAEGLMPSSRQYKDRLKEMLKDASMTKDQFESQYGMSIEEYAEENNFYDNIVMEKVDDYIYKNAVAEEPKAENEDSKASDAADESGDR